MATSGPVAEAASKRFTNGTHRACPPAETLARLRPRLAEFGITRVANLTGLDRLGLPVVAVCRPNARSSAVFHGKGAELLSAKVSGIMEAIETWHAENIVLPLRFGSAADLSGQFSLAAIDGLPRRPGAACTETTPLLWIEGQDLLTGGPVLVPFEMVHANFTVDGPPGSGCFAMTTNGLASGNTRLEATSHGLCEVIERDATALWRAKPGPLQDAMRLDLASVTDDLCRDALDRFARHKLEVAVWDITTDIGVPAFQCLIADETGSNGHTGSGAGCHPSRGVALLRALTEAAQVRMTYIVGSREDLLPEDYEGTTLRARHRSAIEAIARTGAARPFERCSHQVFPTFEAEVEWIGERLRLAGLRQAIVVDLSRDTQDLCVVRVVIPYLEGSDHHRDSYVPGLRQRQSPAHP